MGVCPRCVNGLLKGGLYRQVGGLFIEVHALCGGAHHGRLKDCGDALISSL